MQHLFPCPVYLKELSSKDKEKHKWLTTLTHETIQLKPETKHARTISACRVRGEERVGQQGLKIGSSIKRILSEGSHVTVLSPITPN